MFRCFAGHQTKPGEKRIRLVLTKRSKAYPPRTYVAAGRKHEDPGGIGFETVREVNFCPTHAAEVR